MKIIAVICFAMLTASLCVAQQSPAGEQAGAGATAASQLSNLPIERIGVDDLIGISVYDSPELTRTVRVNSDGDIRLPMLKEPIHAAGLYPEGLENAIAAALTKGNVLVDPIVTVNVVEYRSRPITVVGAVKNPLTFQETGTVSLLDAISRAGGLSENAGSEILISREEIGTDGKSATLVQRIPVRGLLDGVDSSLNLTLRGGEEIRVPEAGRVFVVGDVKKPGAFYITDGSESSVLKALALSEGLDTFPAHTAYIYRREGGAGNRNEIPVELKKIMNRKAPDVALRADDILYVPNARGTKAGLKVLEESLGIGAVMGTALIYVYH